MEGVNRYVVTFETVLDSGRVPGCVLLVVGVKGLSIKRQREVLWKFSIEGFFCLD